MDLFRNLPWKISEPSMLDVGTNFIKEETVAQSFLFQNNFKPECIEENSKSTPKKNGFTDKQKKTLKKYRRESRLNIIQHKKCLQALLLLESDRPLSSFTFQEQQSITCYNNLKTAIHAENEEFLKFVEDEWNKKLHKRVGIMPKLLEEYGMRKRYKKFGSVKEYPEFYKQNFMVPLSRNEHPVEIEHGPCLLQLGSVTQLNIPDLEKKDSCLMNKLPPIITGEIADNYLKPTKHCVSKDVYAEFLAKKSVSNVVISASSLKAIVDNYGPDYSTSWDIPIVVKEHEEDGKKFKVVYVDKPLPKRHITSADIELNVRKRFLKHILSSKNYFSFETPQFIKDHFPTNISSNNESNDNNMETNKYGCISAKKQKLSSNSSSSSNLIIDDENMEYEYETNDNLDEKRKLIPDFPASPNKTFDDRLKEYMKYKSKTVGSLEKQNLHSDSPASPDQTEDDLITKQMKIKSVKEQQNIILDSPASPDQTFDDIIDKQMKNETQTIDSLKEKQKLIPDSPASPDQTFDGLINKQMKIKSVTINSLKKKQMIIPDSPVSPDQTYADLIDKQMKNKSQTIDSLKEKQNLIPDSPASPDQTIDELTRKQINDEDAEEGEITEEEKIEDVNIRKRKKVKNKNMVKKMNHNVAYKLWNIKIKDEENLLMKNCVEKKDIKIIIRTKSDGYMIQPKDPFIFTNIVPKMEYQREHGGQILTKSELLRQWATLHFNPYSNSNLLRVRIFPNGNKYMKIETLNLNKITNECLRKQNFNPKETLGTLYNVLAHLTNLKEEGNYILHHTQKQGPFATLYQNSDNACNTFNLRDLYKEENCSVSQGKKWPPIDTTCVLPYHQKNGIMPGLFAPNGQFLKKGTQGRGQQKGKGKRKKKNTKNVSPKK